MSRELTLESIHFSALSPAQFIAKIAKLLASETLITKLSIAQILQILNKPNILDDDSLIKFMSKLLTHPLLFADVILPLSPDSSSVELFDFKNSNYVKLLAALIKIKKIFTDVLKDRKDIFGLIDRLINQSLRIIVNHIELSRAQHHTAAYIPDPSPFHLINLCKLLAEDKDKDRDEESGDRIPAEFFTTFVDELCKNCNNFIVLYQSRISFIVAQIDSSLIDKISELCSNYSNIMALCNYEVFKAYILANITTIFANKTTAILNETDACSLISELGLVPGTAEHQAIESVTCKKDHLVTAGPDCSIPTCCVW
jgi:hypothetical protein